LFIAWRSGGFMSAMNRLEWQTFVKTNHNLIANLART